MPDHGEIETRATSTRGRRIHVAPDARGAWLVRSEESGETLSTHGSETEAERAARFYARSRGEDHVLIRDRYQRVHEASVADR